MKQQLRVWWVPQVPMQPFYIPVTSPEEGHKVIYILAAYDCFQYNHNVKPDYSNAGGLEYFDEEAGEWKDWYFEDSNSYYEDLDKYIEERSIHAAEIRAQDIALLEQVHFA